MVYRIRMADIINRGRRIKDTGEQYVVLDQTSISSFAHGSNRDVDTTAEALTSTSFAAKKGVTVVADVANSGIVYVGNFGVTAGTTAATDGFPLGAGESLTIEVNNPNLIYVIASVNNQVVYWAAA